MNIVFKSIILVSILLSNSFSYDENFTKSPVLEEKNSKTTVEQVAPVTLSKPTINKNPNMKENDDLGKLTKYETMSKEEIIALINNAYKKGFSDGAQETQLVMKAKIEKMTDFMDQLFAFHKLYLEGKLQPPKIGIVKTPVQVMDSGRTMVIEQEHLEIIEPAKFVEQPKDWKNFLW